MQGVMVDVVVQEGDRRTVTTCHEAFVTLGICRSFETRLQMREAGPDHYHDRTHYCLNPYYISLPFSIAVLS